MGATPAEVAYVLDLCTLAEAQTRGDHDAIVDLWRTALREDDVDAAVRGAILQTLRQSRPLGRRMHFIRKHLLPHLRLSPEPTP